jgi:hypothetical protein
MSHIIIDEKGIKRIRELYELAVQYGQESFIYEGHEFLTSYAKYFLEYYEPKLGVRT